MNASFYDLLKYAATGIASPEMTYFDKMRALSMAGGGTIKTLTGIPPLSFTGNGSPLISLSMLGNTKQTGTPTPDNIIMPDFCGVRTGNLIPYPYDLPTTETSGVIFSVDSDGRITATGRTTANITAVIRYNIGMLTAGTYTFSVTGKHEGLILYVRDMVAQKTIADILSGSTSKSTTFALAENTSNNIRVYMTRGVGYDVNFDCTVQIESGSTATEHEPYGYKIPLTCAGQTVPVYLGQTQTVRRVKKLVLTGEETWGKDNDFDDPLLGDYFYTNFISEMLPYSSLISSHFITGNKNIINSVWVSLTDRPRIGVTISKNYTGIIDTDNKQERISKFKTYLASEYAAGHPVTIWYVLAEPETAIVNEPLCKIGDYADELHSTDAGVSIPTANGDNTLTVDTDLQPSSMKITGHIE